MSLLVTGSIGIDTVETPESRVESVIGGSAVYFSLAAALFADVRMVGVVGEDMDWKLLEPLKGKRIDMAGIEQRAGSQTFRWHGKYLESMNDRETVSVDLNVLAERGPSIPPAYCDSEYVFLANTHPALQAEFLAKLPKTKLAVCDTMDLWITTEADALRDLLTKVHGIVVNDDEARQLTGNRNLLAAGRQILHMGPKFVVIKKGENGALLVANEDVFIMPAYPAGKVVDPTGCGDSFAGAMMGHLAAAGHVDVPTLRAAIARGTAAASITLESFSIDAIARAKPEDVHARMSKLLEMTRFD